MAFNRQNSAAGSSIEQTIPNVTIGKTVEFSLDYFENGHNGNPSVLVEILDGNGTVIFSETATISGTSITHSFTSVTSTYTVRITDTSSGNLSEHDAHIDNVSFDVACFTQGTLIRTPDGSLPIEDVKVGQLVCTADHGAQPVRWVGYRELDSDDLARHPNLRPIRIAKGALGQGIPERDLIVAPQHRILLRSKIARRMYDCDEILVPAKKLVGNAEISVANDMSKLRYYHFLLDRHEVVFPMARRLNPCTAAQWP